MRLLAPLGLALFALGRTGGAASDLSPLLLVLLACASLSSREAGRFLLVGVYGGLVLLVALHPPASAAAARLLALRALWPLAAFLALEAAGRAVEKSPGAEPRGPEASAKGAARDERRVAPAPRRDPRSEVLHDLRSLVTVLRVYSDLVGESARRGELPRRRAPRVAVARALVHGVARRRPAAPRARR